VCLAALGAVVLVAACTGRRGGSQLVHVRVAVGGQAQLIYLPTTLARELGYYQDEGLDVDIEDLQGGSKALQALIGGSADVVSGFYDHTIQMAAEGRALVAFVTMLRFPGLVLVVSPQRSGEITSIEGVKGKIAGVTAAGSSSHLIFSYLLQKHGVAADQVSVTAIGTAATAIAAVERGKVDVGMMAEPAFTLMQRRNPSARILADLRTSAGVRTAMGSPTYPASVLYSKADWVGAHREAAAHLARAILRTLAWMHAHTPKEIADRTPAAFRGDDPALYVQALTNSMDMYSTDGIMDEAGSHAVYQVLSQSIDKVRQTAIETSKTYTNQFVTAR
jgi:NitT/TauT family transport system substrate-binding protein